MTLPLLEADSIDITILIDNQIDALLPGEESVKRHGFGKGVYNPFIDAPEVASSMHAEHGFSALVTVTKGVDRHTILFDAGISPNGMIENMDRLEVDPKAIEALVLSHGHFDHTGGITGLHDRLGRAGMPLMIHPAAYTNRRAAPPGRDPSPLPPPSRLALEGAGFELVEARDPSLVFQDCVLITGEVPRTTEFEQGFPFFQREVEGRWEPEPHLADDQAMVVNVRGKGLVVLSGCGHAGIVNIVRRAQELTGTARIAGIIGGFHLSGPFFEPIIGPTVAALREFAPAMVVPGHCTGYKSQMAIAAAMPEAYVHNAVGTTYSF